MSSCSGVRASASAADTWNCVRLARYERVCYACEAQAGWHGVRFEVGVPVADNGGEGIHGGLTGMPAARRNETMPVQTDSIRTERIILAVSDGTTMPAYVARPASAGGPGLLVFQEAFGVNAHIRLRWRHRARRSVSRSVRPRTGSACAHPARLGRQRRAYPAGADKSRRGRSARSRQALRADHVFAGRPRFLLRRARQLRADFGAAVLGVDPGLPRVLSHVMSAALSSHHKQHAKACRRDQNSVFPIVTSASATWP